jgi:hypothetical protein
MSHAPLAPSSHYKARGMRPVYAWGLVLWLTPLQYQQILEVDPSFIQDATDEQIDRQDEWYEQAREERRLEAEEWTRIARLFADGGR